MDEPDILNDYRTRHPSRNDLLWYNQIKKPVTISAANYVVSAGEDILYCTATTTVTLPLATRGRELHVIKAFTGGSITLNCSSTNTIMGASALTIIRDYASVYLKVVNGNWWLMANDLIEGSVYYDDLRISLSTTKAPASSTPTWTAYKGSEVPAFSASATNVLYFTAQLPHSYKEGSNIDFHIHVAYPDNTAGNSRWTFTYSWINIDGTFPTATSTSITLAAPAVLDKHVLHDIALNISGAGKLISSILLCSVSRIGGDAEDTYANVIYGLSADFHYEVDGLGSRTETAK